MNKSNRKAKNAAAADLSTDNMDSHQQTGNGQPLLPSNKTDRTLKFMYVVACFANLVINLDHGILPACTQEIMRDLHIDELGLGLLGTVVYVGLLLGSITSGPLLQNYSCKKIIAGSTLGNIISLFIFPISENFFLLCLSRGLVGFFQVFLVIYFPVWVDSYGGSKKTLWITFLQLGVALGVFFGYGLTALFVKYFTWRVSFYTQIALLTPCCIAFLFFDESLMDTNHAEKKESKASASEEGHEKYLLTISHSGSFFGNEIRDYVLGNEPQANADGHHSKLPIGEDDDYNTDKLTYFDYIKILWNKKVYIYTMLAISSLYFVITGIQFWISDYMRTVLRKEKETVFMAFGLISITGPTLGVVIGGTILDRLGGYTGKEALDFCLVFGSLASLVALPVPFLNNFMAICVLLWFLLFFGGGLMPAVIGIMLSSIPKKMRAMGYSTAQIVQNFLGYVPAPVVYGFMVEVTGGEESRFGMILLMLWSTFGVFALFAAKNARIQKHLYYMKQQYIDIGEEEVERPDLFQPKPNIALELPEIRYDMDNDQSGSPNDGSRRFRHSRTRTFGEAPPEFSRRKSTIVGPKAGKIEGELKALGQATVDYGALRKSKTGKFLSKENLGNLNMMFGKGIDNSRKEIKEEMQ